MEEDDDDLYDPVDTLPTGEEQKQNNNGAANGKEENEMEEVEVEEEVDDDEFNIITEATPETIASVQARQALRNNNDSRPPSDLAALKSSISVTPAPRAGTSATATPIPAPAAPAAVAMKPVAPQKPGSAYPAPHMSDVEVNATPVHPATGKPITETDLDAEFGSEDDKPWRRPGTDLSDYFNYGFDEFTWASYCLKQQEVRQGITDQKKQMEEMTAFLGMPMPGMPGMPGMPMPTPASVPPPSMTPQSMVNPMGAVPGMPDIPPEVMQSMLTAMMAQGVDPSTMDPMTLMQQAQAMMGQMSQQMGGQPGQAGFGGQMAQGMGPQMGQQMSQQMGQQIGQQMGYGSFDQRGNYGPGMRGPGKGGRRW